MKIDEIDDDGMVYFDIDEQSICVICPSCHHPLEGFYKQGESELYVHRCKICI
jgi:hypothetical protein